MIFFDVTKTGRARQRSGLTRVSQRLRDTLGPAAREATWVPGLRRFQPSTAETIGPRDWLLTAELFSEDERPGVSAFIATRPCRLAAIFHDAIPLKHPHITWPQSVARHPAYMKMLARFDRVWAVSAASREELLGFWRWQGLAPLPPVEVLALGADSSATPRVTMPAAAPVGRLRVLCIGILEPRKNQAFLLEICDDLWREGIDFELHVIGRVNPHFGAPVVARLQALQRVHGARLQFHPEATDPEVEELYRGTRATLFPTVAEGCGLPLLESLWRGVPCLCSDLPVLRENADGGGCVPVAGNDVAEWTAALRRILTDPAAHGSLAAAARTRSLPTWAAAAATLQSALV
jgi:glycosyltransferase involved in cell wall biosynthesis